MKRPRRLTRSQKEYLSAHYMKPEDWMLVEETGFYLKIINKQTGKVRSVDKFKRAKKGIRRNDKAGN